MTFTHHHLVSLSFCFTVLCVFAGLISILSNHILASFISSKSSNSSPPIGQSNPAHLKSLSALSKTASIHDGTLPLPLPSLARPVPLSPTATIQAIDSSNKLPASQKIHRPCSTIKLQSPVQKNPKPNPLAPPPSPQPATNPSSIKSKLVPPQPSMSSANSTSNPLGTQFLCALRAALKENNIKQLVQFLFRQCGSSGHSDVATILRSIVNIDTAEMTNMLKEIITSRAGPGTTPSDEEINREMTRWYTFRAQCQSILTILMTMAPKQQNSMEDSEQSEQQESLPPPPPAIDQCAPKLVSPPLPPIMSTSMNTNKDDEAALLSPVPPDSADILNLDEANNAFVDQLFSAFKRAFIAGHPGPLADFLLIQYGDPEVVARQYIKLITRLIDAITQTLVTFISTTKCGAIPDVSYETHYWKVNDIFAWRGLSAPSSGRQLTAEEAQNQWTGFKLLLNLMKQEEETETEPNLPAQSADNPLSTEPQSQLEQEPKIKSEEEFDSKEAILPFSLTFTNQSNVPNKDGALPLPVVPDIIKAFGYDVQPLKIFSDYLNLMSPFMTTKVKLTTDALMAEIINVFRETLIECWISAKVSATKTPDTTVSDEEYSQKVDDLLAALNLSSSSSSSSSGVRQLTTEYIDAVWDEFAMIGKQKEEEEEPKLDHPGNDALAAPPAPEQSTSKEIQNSKSEETNHPLITREPIILESLTTPPPDVIQVLLAQVLFTIWSGHASREVYIDKAIRIWFNKLKARQTGLYFSLGTFFRALNISVLEQLVEDALRACYYRFPAKQSKSSAMVVITGRKLEEPICFPIAAMHDKVLAPYGNVISGFERDVMFNIDVHRALCRLVKDVQAEELIGDGSEMVINSVFKPSVSSPQMT